MDAGTDVAGIIVAGGAGSRAGGRKPLLEFAGGTLLEAVIARVRGQVGSLALNVPVSEAERYRERCAADIAFVFEAHARGPLGGVIAGLEWLSGTGSAQWLASFPADTPFLPRDLVAQLCAASRVEAPAVAADRLRVHALCGLWPLSGLARLRTGFEAGQLRSMMSAVEALGGRVCHVACDEHAFFNVNTQEDLARAEFMARAP